MTTRETIAVVASLIVVLAFAGVTAHAITEDATKPRDHVMYCARLGLNVEVIADESRAFPPRHVWRCRYEYGQGPALRYTEVLLDPDELVKAKP